MTKLLVVDDQQNMRTALAMMLRGAGYEVDEAASGVQGAELGSAGAYDAVVTDLRMEGCDGLDVLRAIKRAQPMTEVIVMTAWGTIESAVEAMRLGACDYLQKPFGEDELLLKLAKAVESRRLHGEVQLFAEEFRKKYHVENIIGRSQPIRDVLSRVVRVGPTDATVLITGESGTGKELIARAVHTNSKRAERPFVTVNCAAISETLLESELFGHARGAFTGAVSARKGLFEEAEGGTFFFDEIAETNLSFQAKLLRAIQDRSIRRIGENKPVPVNIRVIAATNVNLTEAVADRRFREDLYYRLNVVRFELPPLRDRIEDVPILLRFFLDKFNRKMGMQARFEEGVSEALLSHPFPGNIRELENMVEQAVALSGGGLIRATDLLPTSLAPKPAIEERTLASVVDRAERVAIEEALRDSGGSRERAAEVLGVSATTLWRKMGRLGITFEQR